MSTNRDPQPGERVYEHIALLATADIQTFEQGIASSTA
jgi:hypothetical protein